MNAFKSPPPIILHTDSAQQVAFEEQTEAVEKLTKQVAKGGGIAFIGTGAGKLLTLGLHILLGRVLGPSAYGLYAIGMSVAVIARSFAPLGLNQGIVRFCSLYRGKGDNERIKGTILSALGISLFSSIVVACILFTFSDLIANRFFHDKDLSWVIRVFAIELPFFVIVGITASVAQSFRRIAYHQGIQNIFYPLTTLILVSVAFLLGFQLAGALYGVIVAGILSAVAGLYFLVKIFPVFSSNLKPKYQAQTLLRFSGSVFLAGLAYALNMQIDRIILGHFEAPYQVGVYNAATVIALQIGTIAFHPLSVIMSPIIADLYNQNRIDELKLIFQTATRWMFSIAAPFLIIVSLFAREIMNCFGSAFASGWLVLMILALSRFIFVSVGPTTELLQMSGRQNLDLLNNASFLAINIGLNLWLIPLMGSIGAAIATAASVIVFNITQLIEIRILLKINPYSTKFVRPCAIVLGISIFGILLKYVLAYNSWVLITVVLLISYFTLFYLVGLNDEDKLIIATIEQRIKRKQV
jgi:O-antigen/teichoic acid export membrane protein